MPDVMDLDHPNFVIVADPAEGPDKVSRFNGQTAASSEDETRVLPGIPERFTVGRLLLLPGEQCCASESDNRQVTVAGTGLDRAGSEGAADALELLPDSDDPGFEIDISPAKSEHFTSSHAIDEQEHERGIKRIGRGCPQEGKGLFGRPGTDLGWFTGRQLGKPSNIAADQIFAAGSCQRDTQNLAHHVDVPE